MEITYLVKFTEKRTYKNIAKATFNNTDPVEDDNTIEVTKLKLVQEMLHLQT